MPDLIDSQLGILKRARPYQDSDHVLNVAYNLLCGGQVLDDIEHRRKDAAFLDMLGAEAIPDPTTAGDYCRRFAGDDIWRLMGIINQARLVVWQRNARDFGNETARIDADGFAVKSRDSALNGPVNGAAAGDKPSSADLQFWLVPSYLDKPLAYPHHPPARRRHFCFVWVGDGGNFWPR